MLYPARAHGLGGRRSEAIKLNERILDDCEQESAALRARVWLVTPYRPRTGTGGGRLPRRPPPDVI